MRSAATARPALPRDQVADPIAIIGITDSPAVAPESGPRTRKGRLDVYLVNHNEYAVSRGMQGMLPYVRIVGHDMKRGVKE